MVKIISRAAVPAVLIAAQCACAAQDITTASDNKAAYTVTYHTPAPAVTSAKAADATAVQPYALSADEGTVMPITGNDFTRESLQHAAPTPAQSQPVAAAANVPSVNGKPIAEEKLATPNAQELQNRSHVDDVLYPAGNAPIATDSFYEDQDKAAAAGDLEDIKNNAKIITTAEGLRVLADDSGQPLLDTEGNMIKAPLEQLRKVTVNLLTTVDSAVIEAFKSLQSSITMGVGGRGDNLTAEDIAPTLRQIEIENDGTLSVTFSLQAAEAVLRRNGESSWAGLSNPILIWMASLDGSAGNESLSLVSGQNLNSFAADLLSAAPDYRYRVMFPIMDLEDIQSVQTGSVIDSNGELLAKASSRYGSDYFMAATVNNTADGGVTLKWTLFNRKGEAIQSSVLSGLPEEVASLSTGDIAGALMQYQQQIKYAPVEAGEKIDPASIASGNVDIERVGAGDGFIRLKISEVNSLADIQTIRSAFVSYGYDGDIRIIGFDNGFTVVELVTNANVTTLEGTIKRSGDFNYLAPWVFSLKHSTGRRDNVMRDGISQYRYGNVNKQSVTAESAPAAPAADHRLKPAVFSPLNN